MTITLRFTFPSLTSTTTSSFESECLSIELPQIEFPIVAASAAASRNHTTIINRDRLSLSVRRIGRVLAAASCPPRRHTVLLDFNSSTQSLTTNLILCRIINKVMHSCTKVSVPVYCLIATAQTLITIFSRFQRKISARQLNCL